MNILKFVLVALAAICANWSASAGEWHAERLRGVVLTMVDGQWAPVGRGDIIEDSRIIRTGANGQVTFRSGEQIVEMRPDSQIQISALEGRDYTWILHAGGEIVADVDARDVEHFGVRTHHLVAVVKGTRFTVVADYNGGSVAVERGAVSVSEADRGLSVVISSGQRAFGGSGRLTVDGRGNLPIVVDAHGRPVVARSPAFARASGPRAGLAPGNSASAPGRSGEAPGNSAAAPERSNDTPGGTDNRNSVGNGNGANKGHGRN